MVPVLSEVLQVYTFGLLMFAAFVNDLPLHVSLALVFIFADDSKCFKIISSPSDIISLQNSINQTLNWSNINDVFLNESRFFHIHFGKELGCLVHTIFFCKRNVYYKTQLFERSRSLFSSSLKSWTHCEVIASNAHKILELIQGSFSMHFISAKKLLYVPYTSANPIDLL